MYETYSMKYRYDVIREGFLLKADDICGRFKLRFDESRQKVRRLSRTIGETEIRLHPMAISLFAILETRVILCQRNVTLHRRLSLKQ